MAQIALNIPVVGQPNSTEDPKVSGNFNALQTLVNGNIDLTNLSPAAIQALQASTAPLSSHATIAASESRTNTAYGTLTTPDQVAGLILPTNGLIAVWYQATWQESVAGAGRAAIFLNAGASNQLQVQNKTNQPDLQAAATSFGVAAINQPLVSSPIGLVTFSNGTGFSGDRTSGQAVGIASLGATTLSAEVGGTVNTFAGYAGGPCYIFAAAGTYTVSVQFKASSGSVTASSRKLWIQILPFG